MNEVVLVNPRVGNESYAYPHAPLNLLYLSAVLEQNGYSVKIVDARMENDFMEIIEKLIKSNPLCVGISSLTGRQISSGLHISEFIKSYNPELPIVWGGIHPTLFPEQTIEDKRVDIVVRKEGEITFLEVVNALEKNKSLNGVLGTTYKENGKIRSNPDRPFLDMNKLPLPAWHLIDVKKYMRPYPYLDAEKPLPIHTSRGCPWRCAFCYNLFINKRTWRSKTAENTFEEIKFMVDKFGVDGLIIREDNFVADPKRAIKICQLIKKEKLDITWNCNMRATDFTDELLKNLKMGGLGVADVGSESGSQRILDFIKKDLTVSQTLESAKQAKKFEIIPVYSFIIGLPTETKEDIILTLKLIKDLRKINPNSQIINLNIFTPYPGGELYEISKQYGFKEPKTLEEWGEYTWNTLNIPWVKDAKFINLVNALGVFALNEKAISSVRKKNLLFNFAGWFLQRSAKFRWENEFWSFPIEFDIFRKFSRIMEKEGVH